MKIVYNNRTESLKAGYKAMLETPIIASRVNFSLDQFIEACKDFEVWGFEDKEPIGMMFFKGNHPHIAILKKYHGKCGKILSKALSLAVDKYGELVADVHKDNPRALHFVEKIGFKLHEKNGDIISYRIGKDNV